VNPVLMQMCCALCKCNKFYAYAPGILTGDEVQGEIRQDIFLACIDCGSNQFMFIAK
jgi:hypothetical protein